MKNKIFQDIIMVILKFRENIVKILSIHPISNA